MIAVRETRPFRSTADEAGPRAWSAPTQFSLRRVLVAADAVAVAAAWAVVLGPFDGFDGSGRGLIVVVAAITLASLAVVASQQLYLARVCRLRSVEISRLVRVSAVTGLLVHLAGPRWGVHASALLSLSAAAAMAANLVVLRGIYSACLRRRRSTGRHNRPVVIVGPHAEVAGIQTLIRTHPELGFDAVATLGPAGDVMEALEDHRSDTVVIATGAFTGIQLNRLTRELLDAGVHVHLSTGLSGIDQRRLRAQPIAREPMFYLEPLRISPWQAAAKRTLDIAGSSIGILAALPVLLFAAAAIKLEDRGPVLFRHKRVGRNGEEFTIFKLRTMVPNADRQLHLVAADNQRTGPLFKSHNDPRITKVGRLLRATSVDELPQLINVFLGTMSLVGPRPALAHEVAQFDSELRTRERVRPGITGLWQIEGRDDPSFDAYRRLDLYYVENWSLELDFVILFLTGQAVVKQALRDRRKQWKPSGSPLHVIDLTASATEAP